MSYKILYDNQKKEAESGVTLFQIEALIDMPQFHVSKGDLGGWIQFKNNLSESGNAWIDIDSTVTGKSKVISGQVLGSRIYGDCTVEGGVIQDSRLAGTCEIGKYVYVLNSKIYNVKAKGDVNIWDSMMGNFELIPEDGHAQHFDHVNCIPWETVELKNKHHWKNVELKASTFKIEANLDISNSKINVTWFRVLANAEISHVVTENTDMRFIINTSEKTSFLNGKGKDAPLRIKTNSLHVKDSMIDGSIVLDGNMRIIESVVKDFSRISMKGKLIRSVIKEFAVIDIVSVGFTDLSIQLSDDAVFDETAYEQFKK